MYRVAAAQILIPGPDWKEIPLVCPGRPRFGFITARGAGLARPDGARFADIHCRSGADNRPASYYNTLARLPPRSLSQPAISQGTGNKMTDSVSQFSSGEQAAASLQNILPPPLPRLTCCCNVALRETLRRRARLQTPQSCFAGPACYVFWDGGMN